MIKIDDINDYAIFLYKVESPDGIKDCGSRGSGSPDKSGSGSPGKAGSPSGYGSSGKSGSSSGSGTNTSSGSGSPADKGSPDSSPTSRRSRRSSPDKDGDDEDTAYAEPREGAESPSKKKVSWSEKYDMEESEEAELEDGRALVKYSPREAAAAASRMSHEEKEKGGAKTRQIHPLPNDPYSRSDDRQ